MNIGILKLVGDLYGGFGVQIKNGKLIWVACDLIAVIVNFGTAKTSVKSILEFRLALMSYSKNKLKNRGSTAGFLSFSKVRQK